MAERKRRKRDIYIAILRAADRGEGLHLSADEAHALAQDDAVRMAAMNGLEDGEELGGSWANVDPYRPRIGANRTDAWA